MNTKKMTAFIVGAMLIATVLVMAVSAAGMDRSKYADMPRMVYEYDADDDTGIYINDFIMPNAVGTVTTLNGIKVPTVRIYGEEDAIYPTQSYTGADDFIYPDPVDAFDPGVIGKDSVTFNPAYLYNAASVDGDDDLEDDMKVFFRIFYEPEYGHVKDGLMEATITDQQRKDISMPEGALVTETTYMLVNDNYNTGHSGDPITGAADVTQFTMPVNSGDSYDGTPGMDVNETVDLLSALHGDTVTDGEIEVGMTYDQLATNVPKRFMDHEVKFTRSDSNYAFFEIKYLGNMREEEPATTTISVPLFDQKLYVTRYHYTQATTDPAHRWFITVSAVNCAEWCTFTIGRHLAAGETFYVDGVRYDMPAIYVTDDADEFKYITLQSPVPKCTGCDCAWVPGGYAVNQEDYSHVSNQWLARLLPGVPVWVLPPFDAGHVMIDDIDLAKFDTGVTEPDWEICTEAGDIINGEKPALGFYYVDEAEEDRFDSSLAERHARKDGVGLWNWWSIFTKPYQYTELVLPNDEKPQDAYVANDQCMSNCADGNEYLITTSFIAPNCEAEERTLLSKSDRECHDIIDRAAEIAKPGDSRRDAYLNMPRMAFEYNAVDTEDLFVNGVAGDPTVRIYGEGGAIYPTQSLTDDKDFIYPKHVDAFDPGVIAKDSVTFNPAYIHSAYKNKEIQIDNGNGDEKVFLRAFYDPGYAHAIDAKMKIEYPNELRELNGTYRMPEGALVTETTYMLVKYSADGHSGLPKAGSAGEPGSSPTEFMLPINSLDGTVPGMDNARVVELTDADYGGSLTSGEIEVSMTWDSINPGNARAFMDHRIRYRGTDAGGHPVVDVWYVGNMQNRHDERRYNVEFVEGQKTYIDRHNQLSTTTTPKYRWFINVQNILGNNECKLTLGRRLVAGETFYVDGVRYDMPAIYVTEDAKFKYITFQSPLPKCNGPMWANDDSDQWDWSHVPSQWLANLVPQANDGGNDNNVANVWVLPPFNEDHTMIDDIGIPKVSCRIDSEAGNILGVVGELEFNYTVELTEDRFDTSLAERHAYDDSGAEIWNWWSVFTKPYQYTELVLPDQETATMADGNEYLITTSFIAPNCEDEEREELCKSDREVHDIIDRASTLLNSSGPVVPDCPADISGATYGVPDETVDIYDIAYVIDNWGQSGSAADLSGSTYGVPDGTVDIYDIAYVIDNWGTCP